MNANIYIAPISLRKAYVTGSSYYISCVKL